MTASLRDGELESAEEMAAALSAGDVTSTELVERALARAEAWQPATNAFSQLWPEEALEAAAATPDGVPLAVKDLYDVAGHETTGCCEGYRGTLAAMDAPTVARCRAAGLILIGKTNQHELAAGGTNLVSACGRTGNPWDPARMTGGSSGGSGAAVAAGVVPWALGSDTGGSIRIPAAMCGMFGLKPTYGQIPLQGLMPLAPSMDCPGPMAAALRDLWALYRVLSGEPVLIFDIPEAERDRRLRVALPGGFFTDSVHEETLRAVESVAAALEAAGVAVEPTGGEGIGEVRRTWMEVCTPEFFDAHPLLRDRRHLLAPQVRRWYEQGERMSDAERDRARRRREEISEWFRKALDGFDALLIPTTPYPAPRADQDEVDLGAGRRAAVEEVGSGWITCSVNLAGLPAINLPAAVSTGGMPVGASLVGAAGDESKLFALAALWESATAYRPGRPPLPPS